MTHDGHDLPEVVSDEVAGSEQSIDAVYYFGRHYTGGDLAEQPAVGTTRNRPLLFGNFTSRATMPSNLSI